jgi:hypothetical protein
MGEPAVQCFYPPTILFRLLPLSPPATFLWNSILHIWLAGLGMYILMRDLGTGKAPAIFSVVSYMFSGAIFPQFYAGHPFIIHCMAWAPWIFWSYRRLLESEDWSFIIPTAIFTALAALSWLHPQFILMIVSFPIGYFFLYAWQQVMARNWRRLIRALLLSAGVTILAIGLSATQIMITAEFVLQSSRIQAPADISDHTIQLWDLGTVVIPFLWHHLATGATLGFERVSNFSGYAGFLTIFMIVPGLFNRDKGRRHLAYLFLVIALLGPVIALRGSPVMGLIHRVLPYITYPGRFMFLWIFSVAVLGGLGLEVTSEWLSEDRRILASRLRWLKIVLDVGIVLTAIGLIAWTLRGEQFTMMLQSAGYFYFVETGIFVAGQMQNLLWLLVIVILSSALVWSAARGWFSARVWSWLAVGLLLLDMLFYAWHLVPLTDVTEFYNPSDPIVALSLDRSEIRLQEDRDIDVMTYLVPSLQRIPMELASNRTLRDLGLEDGRGAQLLAGGYFVTTEPVSTPSVEVIQQAGSAYLYGYIDRWPRIYAAPAVQVVERDSEALAAVAAEDFDPYRVAVVAVSGEIPDLPSGPSEERAEFDAEFVDYGLNDFRAHVQADRPVMVVFSETYYPGWNAWVDGEPAPIWRTNYAFRGVVVGAGEHVIEMAYQPRSFAIGAAISAVTLAILVMLVVAWGVGRLRSRGGGHVEASGEEGA